MPAHDWTRVDAGTFHDLHQAWITHLKERLNGGILPPGYYAMSEQIAAKMHPDVLALRDPARTDRDLSKTKTLETAPKVQWRVTAKINQQYHRKVRTVVVRRLDDHEVVAFIEVVSRANKDRESNVTEIVDKIVLAVDNGVSVLLLDLLPPTKHDPQGIHGAVWNRFDDEPYLPPVGHPLTMASYLAEPLGPEAFVQSVAVGQLLTDMPVFLTPENYVEVPVEETYMAAYRGMPEYWRNVIEGQPNPE